MMSSEERRSLSLSLALSLSLIFVQPQQPLDTDSFEVIAMGCRLAAVVGQIMSERLGAVFLGSCACCLHIRPQVRVVLDVEATAVEGVRTVGGTHDCVGSGDRSRPRIK